MKPNPDEKITKSLQLHLREKTAEQELNFNVTRNAKISF